MEKEKIQTKQPDTAPPVQKKKFKMPDNWIVVFIMVAIVAILSWIIPPGSYDYEQKEINGTMRNLAIDGSFHYLDKSEASPTGFLGTFSALYSGCVEAGGTIFMILCCCACFRIMVQTGAFHAGIGTVMRKMGKKAVALVVLMVGLMKFNWGNKQLCGLFIIMSIVAALICRWKPQKYIDEFVAGCRGMIWGALLAGLARGILVVMNDAKIVDTVIHALAETMKNAPSWLSAQLMLIVQTLINLPISSATGQAAVTMPIMTPLADALGVSRDVACLAFQFGDGLSNLLWPTGGIVIVSAMSDVPYEKWLKWFMPLFFMLLVAQMLLVGGAVLVGL